MDIFQAIILGLVQGLGEFLPISSSGHLILAPWLFGWQDPGLAFDVALHFGTLVAVLAYFWRDWVKIIYDLRFTIYDVKSKTRKTKSQYPPNMLWLLVVATIPGVLAGYFLESYAETAFRNPLLIAFTLAFVGLLLYLADKYAKHRKNIGNMNFADSLIIGLFQAVAIIPGVSRSGSTITAGLATGYDRVSAARFSFLLSTPIIFGATVLKFPDFLSSNIGVAEIVGIATAAISGYIAIWWLIKFVEKVSYKIFFWYRLALAVLIVIVYISM